MSPKVKEWLNHVNLMNRFKIDDIKQDTILGGAIYNGYMIDPDATFGMIRELYPDNQKLMEEVIGNYNTNLLCRQ